MKIRAILFDLDDTLLGNDIEAFIPQYFQLLTNHARRYMEPERFQRTLMQATLAMAANHSDTLSNSDVFWDLFAQESGLDPAELEPYFDLFYRNQFGLLSNRTELRPEAAVTVRRCFELGLKVVVATNPMFPRSAVEHRLAWAGIPVSEFHYDLVTSYENMHAAKPNQAYYWEILDRISCDPGTSLMVGDSWLDDIVPASAIGMFTYWINNRNAPPPDSGLLSGFGSLEELSAKVSGSWLSAIRLPGASEEI